MAEPQTITTALTAQLIIDRIFTEQVERQITFSPVSIIAPFDIIGLDSLHKDITERITIPPYYLKTMQRLNAYAIGNICLYNEIQAINTGAKEIAYYEVNSGPRITRHISPFDQGAQILSNYELASYCDAIKDFLEDFMSTCMPSAAPGKDQEPKIKTLPPVKTFISHLVMDENKKQPFADELKRLYSDLTGKDLAIMFYAAKGYINLRNLKGLLTCWQQFIGRDIKRDEAMSKAMRTLKDNETISNPAMKSYISELKAKQDEILNIYKSIE